jgi:hypothetical protein
LWQVVGFLRVSYIWGLNFEELAPNLAQLWVTFSFTKKCYGKNPRMWLYVLKYVFNILYDMCVINRNINTSNTYTLKKKRNTIFCSQFYSVYFKPIYLLECFGILCLIFTHTCHIGTGLVWYALIAHVVDNPTNIRSRLWRPYLYLLSYIYPYLKKNKDNYSF